jgi:multiple sugar transport system substrate-binding protein
MPTESGAVILYYNADLLQELGLKPPEASWRWDREFLDAARRVTRESGPAETQRFGTEHVNRGYWGGAWWVHVWANGGDLLSKDNRRCTLAEGPAVNGIQFVADLTHKWRVTPTDAARATGPSTGVNVSFFESGRLAIFPSGHFHYVFIKQRAQFRWGVASLPQGQAGSKTWLNAWLTGIGAGTKQQDASWAFMEFWLQPDNYKEFLQFVSWMPPIKMAQPPPLIDPQHWPAMSSGVAQTARPLPALPQIDDILRVMREGLAPVLAKGEQSAQAATQQLCPQVDALLARR